MAVHYITTVKQNTMQSSSPPLWLLFNSLINLYLAVLGLHCCAGFSLAAESRATLQLQCAGFSLQWLLLWISGSRARGLPWLLFPGSKNTGSIVVAHGLSCSVTREIHPDQGSNPCLLLCQADSLSLSQQGRLESGVLITGLPVLARAPSFSDIDSE